ncbi:MAG TPA: type II toxin-antitoxin system HicB family antitoxin [Gaiellaceae bacterium]|nr:type II toxin-antitoxin system HicB family antitoxin [Gaiellaceae bacterium]
MTEYARIAENYLILVEGGPPTNYSAWSPDVLGCVATGDTIEECVAQMKEALAFHLEGLAEDGDPIPVPLGPGVYVAHTPSPAAA